MRRIVVQAIFLLIFISVSVVLLYNSTIEYNDSIAELVLVTDPLPKESFEHGSRCLQILEWNGQKAKKHFNPQFEGIDKILFGSFSQYFQDIYLYHFIFKELKINNHGGIYFDIGSMDPYKFSNTAFFDECMGWKGICIEADPLNANKISNSRRSCNVVRKCMYKTSGLTFEFSNSDKPGLAHIVKQNISNQTQLYVPKLYSNITGNIKCITINFIDVLKHYNVTNKYNVSLNLFHLIELNGFVNIDFIDLDIEGGEIEFLRCFPFDKIRVTVWNIETRDEAKRTIDGIMLRNNYYIHNELHQVDTVYVKREKSVLFPYDDKYQHLYFIECNM